MVLSPWRPGAPGTFDKTKLALSNIASRDPARGLEGWGGRPPQTPQLCRPFARGIPQESRGLGRPASPAFPLPRWRCLDGPQKGSLNSKQRARRGQRRQEKDKTMKQVSDASFEEDVLKAEGPVLVDFWAEWCGPCRQIAPALEELATQRGEVLTVAKVNIDDNPQTPSKYGVRGIPTLMIFKGGQVAATKIGALPKQKLFEWVDSVL
ncbi:Thioredoxin [Pararhodospirillum photometricum DSM 122]|uniref:Thioredoxin n=2 Tax=Pararhodospirillum photometricum TaxID=1084 RepID=H6SLT1_PARPM|nr:Thioredoxin [Pararhodospirillum photometricum DSM 122]